MDNGKLCNLLVIKNKVNLQLIQNIKFSVTISQCIKHKCYNKNLKILYQIFLLLNNYINFITSTFDKTKIHKLMDET